MAYNPESGKYTLKCEICFNDFLHSFGHTKTCSLKCREIRNKKFNYNYKNTKPKRIDLICIICKEQFKGRIEQKVCSQKCRAKRLQLITGRYADTSISSGTVGAISELEVAADLMKKGYSVFRALSPACYCDLIAIKNGEKLSVEVRTGYKSTTGRITFPPEIRLGADIFGIFIRVSNEILYFEKDAKTEINLTPQAVK